MVKIYVRKIREGLITIDDVPSLWREKVMEAMKEDD